MTGAPPERSPLRVVDCPTCAGPSVYAPSNAFRPFCSERCKQIDLGAWASERFTLPEPAEADSTRTDTGHGVQ
jgi:endogenous inhibitor of DNA gyrase (YacG/DUF329 family)